MTQRNIAITNFTNGQLSPTYRGRRDQQKYYSGAKLIQNMIPLPSGGVTRRPPSKFITNLSGSTIPEAIVPWESGPTKSYLIFFGVSTNEVNVTIFKRSSGTTSQVHSFTNSITGTHLDGWNEVKYTQSRDVMYIALDGSASAPVMKLVNGSGGDTDWTLSTVEFIDGPFEEINLKSTLKLNPTQQSGSTVIKAENKSGTPQYIFTSADVGKLVRIRHNVDPEGQTASWWGCAEIDNLTAGTEDGSTGNFHSVDCTVQTFGDNNELSFGADSASTNPAGTINWRLGTYSATTTQPTYVHLFQNRLFMSDSNRLMGSISNNFERHSPTVADQQNNHSQTPDSAIDFKLLDFRAENINFLHSDQVMHIGTNDARYRVVLSNDILSPTTIGVVKQSNVGTAPVRPVTIDDTIYVRYDREALLSTDFNFRRDRYEDRNLNLYSDQILQGKVQRIVHTSYPFNIVWALLDDGTLASLTYDKEQEVEAWAIHHIKDMSITDIAALRAEDEKEVLYLTVQNDLDTPTVVSLQEIDLTTWDYLQTSTSPETKLVDAYIELSSVGSFTGKTHLIDHTVIAIKNGVNYPQSGTVDSSGDMTLDETISGDFHIGLPIETRLETFPIDLPIAGETQIGKMKSINEIEAILHRSLSMSIQLSTSDYSEDVQFRHPDDPVAATPPLFSGSRTVPVSNVSEEEVYLIVTQNEEAPLTILALNARVEVED